MSSQKLKFKVIGCTKQFHYNMPERYSIISEKKKYHIFHEYYILDKEKMEKHTIEQTIVDNIKFLHIKSIHPMAFKTHIELTDEDEHQLIMKKLNDKIKKIIKILEMAPKL